MSEETPNYHCRPDSDPQASESMRRPMRIGPIHPDKCDCCLETKDCITIGFSLKQITLGAGCYGDMIGIAMAQAIAGASGFQRAPDGYQPEPDIHDIEMVGSELWIKDKEEAK